MATYEMNILQPIIQSGLSAVVTHTMHSNYIPGSKITLNFTIRSDEEKLDFWLVIKRNGEHYAELDSDHVEPSSWSGMERVIALIDESGWDEASTIEATFISKTGIIQTITSASIEYKIEGADDYLRNKANNQLVYIRYRDPFVTETTIGTYYVLETEWAWGPVVFSTKNLPYDYVPGTTYYKDSGPLKAK